MCRIPSSLINASYNRQRDRNLNDSFLFNYCNPGVTKGIHVFYQMSKLRKLSTEGRVKDMLKGIVFLLECWIPVDVR